MTILLSVVYTYLQSTSHRVSTIAQTILPTKNVNVNIEITYSTQDKYT